jgi:hypothetical protein
MALISSSRNVRYPRVTIYRASFNRQGFGQVTAGLQSYLLVNIKMPSGDHSLFIQLDGQLIGDH